VFTLALDGLTADTPSRRLVVLVERFAG